jgi:hypothetical protein
MFSKEQKIKIAKEIEKLLLSFNHPEMPKEKPSFHLHVKGKENWSWADIEPNHFFIDNPPSINTWNETQSAEWEKDNE